jgi:transcriptional regulator with XRE-family HTH domain
VKKTTEAMHRALGKAVAELRARMKWSQEDLAHQISQHGNRVGLMLEPSVGMISRWEHGEQAPSPAYRMALARIAGKSEGTEDLAELFRAPMISWHLVAHVKLGSSKDDE